MPFSHSRLGVGLIAGPLAAELHVGVSKAGALGQVVRLYGSPFESNAIEIENQVDMRLEEDNSELYLRLHSTIQSQRAFATDQNCFQVRTLVFSVLA